MKKVAEVPEISSFTVYQLIPYEKDCLAGIGQKGWFIYNYKKKKYRFFPTSHTCNSILTDNQKQIWIGLEDGLLLWNPNTEQQKTFYTTDGLVNNSIRSIIQSEDNIILDIHFQWDNAYYSK